MRIITQKIDDTAEVCPRLGLILCPESKFIRLVFPNSPCDRGGLLPLDLILHINRIRLENIHGVEFSDRRRTELDFEVWRRFRSYRMSIHVEPEPFAPISEIMELARAFAAQCPLQPFTIRNPDFEEFRGFFGSSTRRRRQTIRGAPR
jgi:hypothetical protein